MNELYVGVDTNILCNFGQIERFKWRELFPDAEIVHMLVSATVQEEMDFHKDNARGYLQKRAREFQKIITVAEETEYIYSYESSGVNVRISFLDSPRSSELDVGHFDLSSSDARIVAEYFYEQTQLGRPVIVLANDARPIRMARNVRMEAKRPAQWTADRAEVEDEVVIQQRERIRDLERILGARPKVNFRNLSLTPDYPLPRDFEGFDWMGYLGSLNTALRAVARPTSIEDLINQHGVETYGGFSMGTLSMQLTRDQIEDYRSELEAFFGHFDIPALEFQDRLVRLGRAYMYDFEIENEGQAPDELLSLELKLSSNAVFVEEGEMGDLNDWGLKIPEPPRPGLSLHDHVWDRYLPRENNSGRFDFKLVEDEEQHRVYRCESILHGHRAHITFGILPTSAGAAVEVLVTLRTRNLLDPIARKVTITPSYPRFNMQRANQFLLRHAAGGPRCSCSSHGSSHWQFRRIGRSARSRDSVKPPQLLQHAAIRWQLPHGHFYPGIHRWSCGKAR